MLLLETIRCENGKAAHLRYHQQRLEASLQSLGHASTLDLKELLTPPADGIFRCRVLYDEHGAEVSYHPYLPRTMRNLQAVEDDALEYRLKYADRTALDRLYAHRGDADDILIIQKGLVTDTTIANLAFYDGRHWLTPKRPLLHGTTRQRLLDEGKLYPVDIPYQSLFSFERCAVMNAMLGFVVIEDGIIAPLN